MCVSVWERVQESVCENVCASVCESVCPSGREGGVTTRTRKREKAGGSPGRTGAERSPKSVISSGHACIPNANIKSVTDTTSRPSVLHVHEPVCFQCAHSVVSVCASTKSCVLSLHVCEEVCVFRTIRFEDGDVLGPCVHPEYEY